MMKSVMLLLATIVLVAIARLHFEAFLDGKVNLCGTLFFLIPAVGTFYLAKYGRERSRMRLF